MNDLDMYIAKTQTRLAFFLIGTLVLLCFGVAAILLVPTIKPTAEISGLLVQVVTGVLGLAGSSVAFFFARHRPPSAGDNDSPTVSATTSPDGGSQVTVTSPLSKPQENKQ